MRLKALASACAATASLLIAASGALAYDYGSNFGFGDVNVPGAETVSAFDGTKAIWLGGCDLSNGDTSNGGLGAAPGIRPHCLDLGVPPQTANSALWAAGGTPSWQLNPVTQAGAHPDMSVAFRLRRAPDGFPDGNVKNIVSKLPLGMVGNPEALPHCSAAAAQDIPPGCGPETQAGIATIVLFSGTVYRTQPIYSIEARDTITAEFTIASVSGIANVPLTARGRTNSDYGVDTLALLIPTYLPFIGSSVTVWGVPWAAEHDKYRVESPDFFFEAESAHVLGMPEDGLTPEQGAQGYDPSWGPIEPFFTNPTSCTSGTPTLEVDMDSWQDPVFSGGSLVAASASTDPVTGCEKLEFDPSVTARPTDATADSPAGLDVHLSTPQNNEPPTSIPGNPDLAHDPADDAGAPAYWKTDAGLATAHLRNTTIELPVGTSFNPSAANGLNGCTTAEIGLTGLNPTIFNNDPVTCPESSKLGTLQIDSPLLPDPLLGNVYAAPQYDNPYPGSLTAVYLVAQDEERGLSIKLAGKVDLDPATGQIATTFVDNPQLPFDDFILHLKSGPRAPLNTPAVCGRFKNGGSLTPWSYPDSGPPFNIQDPFDIVTMPNSLACVTEPEDRQFRPGFEAGSTTTQAGGHTGFVLNVTRDDGHQEVSGLSFEMPPGLLANLSETPYCPEGEIAALATRTGLAEAAESICPDASQIGTVDSLAGAGPMPLPSQGKLYLAGPHDPDGAGPQGTAPLSVLAVVPAIAGGAPGAPTFDLGNVAVRSAAYVEPTTGTVHVASADVPHIVGGVPLRIRRISVRIDKPSFMLNPTNCSEMRVGGTIGGAADPFDPGDDIAVSASSRFQVGGCESLGFKPRLQLRLIGKPRRAAYQGLRAVLTPRPGDANIARVAVTMPSSIFLEQEHLGDICTRVQFAVDACPPRSVYGTATAYSPLLEEPLSGPVYLRSSSSRLPDIVVALDGQIDVELVGRIDSVKGKGIRSTFDVVPDAPVSKFVMKMFGGGKSLLVASENLCATRRIRATVRFEAQNGRRLSTHPKPAIACGKAKRRGTAGKRAEGRRNGRR